MSFSAALHDKHLSEHAALVCRDLRKIYPGASQPALDGLNLTVAEGELFGLLGPNGAGKTTAISILCSLLKPSGGSVAICGVDGIKSPRAIRRLIGLVPQEIALYPTLTAHENLTYFGRLYGLRGQTLKDRIETCLSMVCLSDHAHRPVSTFSGGMKRRVNLAAGVLHRPQVLFLDEPTVGIDAQSRHVILENLKQLRQLGMTMIYTTHHMEEAAQFCTRIAIIDEGRIIDEGAPAEMIARAPACRNLEELFLLKTGKDLRD